MHYNIFVCIDCMPDSNDAVVNYLISETGSGITSEVTSLAVAVINDDLSSQKSTAIGLVQQRPYPRFQIILERVRPQSLGFFSNVQTG